MLDDAASGAVDWGRGRLVGLVLDSNEMHATFTSAAGSRVHKLTSKALFGAFDPTDMTKKCVLRDNAGIDCLIFPE